MRVGLFALRMVDRPTGMANYARSLSYALRELDPKVEITLINPHPEASGIDWFQDFPTYTFVGEGKSDNSMVNALRLARGLNAAASSLKLDVLHAPGNIAPFFGPRRGTRRVVSLHDVAPLILPQEHSPRLRAVTRALVPPLRWTADAVLAPSLASARDIRRYGRIRAKQIYFVPLGVKTQSAADLTRWRQLGPGHQLRPPYFLAIGEISPRKNLVRVVHAFRALRRARPDARLVIAGKPADRDSEVWAAAKELGDSVVSTGYVRDEDLHRLYVGATALVFPSLYEGFGLPVLEAMAHGTPVITSSTSSLPEVAGDAGILVDPLSVDEVSRAMVRVLGDPELAAELVNRGHQRVGLFSWQRTAQQTLDVYRRLCSQPARRLRPDFAEPVEWAQPVGSVS